MSIPKPDRVKLALDAYAGPFNCAQSVAVAFQDVSGLDQAQIEQHGRNGGGRAPGGVCGALHAGLELIPDDAERKALSAQFAGIAGSSQCREIRAAKLVSCSGCVETAARLLSSIVDQKGTDEAEPVQ